MKVNVIHKPNRRRNAVKEQWWKRKIQQSVQELWNVEKLKTKRNTDY